jgi:glycosyltransferase involved in cell wall biosynthesis
MKKICMIVFAYYPEDERVRREAEALDEAGYGIDVICLINKEQTKFERFNNINIYRLAIERRRKGKFLYIWQYFGFILKSFVKVSILYFHKKYSVVHIHNMPEVLVFSALIPRIFGAKVILDMHDPMPELYMTKYNVSANHVAVSALICLERLSSSFAHMVLTTNLAFIKLFLARSCKPGKIHIIMNSPQESIFDNEYVSKSTRPEISSRLFRIMYHGTIAERNGLGLALQAIDTARSNIPNIVFDVYGEGDFVAEFLRIRKLLNLEHVINYFGHVPLEKIAEAIQGIDVGLIPNLLSPFTRINFPVRIFEYLSLNKPVIAPRTDGIRDYFDDNSIFYFESGDKRSLVDALIAVYSNPSNRKNVLENGRNVYNKYQWKYEKLKLISCVKNLID